MNPKLTLEKVRTNIHNKIGDRYVDNPELHHTIEVAKDPSGAITIAGQMLVCNDPCHKEFTRLCK